MESRITFRTVEFLSGLDRRVDAALRDAGVQADAPLREALHAAFRTSVDEVIALAKKGREVHERLVQHTVMHALDAIIGVDPEGLIFFWNHGAERLFGYGPEEMLRHPISLLVPQNGDDLPSDDIVQKTFRTKEGRDVVVSLSMAPILTDDGEHLGDLAILHDLTAVRALERQVARTERLALLGQISAGIAHELGTPLNIIRGAAELLLMDKEGGHPDAPDLNTILRQTAKISSHISDLLVFARPADPCLVPVSVPTLLEHSVHLVHSTLDQGAVRISFYADTSLPPVLADPDLLQQVILNLVINARDALVGAQRTDGEIHLRAGIESKDRGPVMVLDCEDNGPGIDPLLRDRIFEPFFSTKPRGKGTGLGLALCRNFIEQMQGELLLDADHSPGSRFRLFLPVATEEDAS